MRKHNVSKVVMVTCLTLGLSVTNVFAGSIKDKSQQRLSGVDRFQTAVAISQQGWTSSNAVVLADANDFPDALVGGPLAFQKNAPILLTNKDSLNETSLTEIKRLNAKDIYVIGDISPMIDNYLTSDGYNVKSINGSDKFKTAVNVGQEVIDEKPTNTIFLSFAYDFPDALSASTFASKYGYPILFTGTDILNEDTKSAIQKWGIKNVFILGGTGVISENIETTLKSIGVNITRLSGESRYDTAMQIVKQFDNNTYNGLTITSGLNFPDALAGSVLAAKENAPIIIYNASNITPTAADFIRTKPKNIYILGGEGAIPENDIVSLLSQTNTPVVGNNSTGIHLTFGDSTSFSYPYLGKEFETGPEKAIYFAVHTNSDHIQDYSDTKRVADDKVLKRTYTNGQVEEFNPGPVSTDDVSKFNDKYDPVKEKERLAQDYAERKAAFAKTEEGMRSKTISVPDSTSQSNDQTIKNDIKVTIFPLGEDVVSYLIGIGHGDLLGRRIVNASLPENIKDNVGGLRQIASEKKCGTPIEIAIVPYIDLTFPNGYFAQDYAGGYTFVLFNNGTPYEQQLHSILTDYHNLMKKYGYEK